MPTIEPADPTPIPPPPPPPQSPPPAGDNTKKWLIGCLLVLILAVLLGLAALLLVVYAAKRQVDAIAPDANRVLEDARRAAKALESSQPAAQQLLQAAEARMRLGRAASAALGARAEQAPEPCPEELARAALPVDADWFGELVNGVPAHTTGTAWMRDPTIMQAANVADQAQATIALDKTLADAGAVAVIHAASADAEEHRFEGYVQLIGYPDGETACTVAFRAEGAGGTEFQSKFWAAEEAALGK